MDSFTAEHIRYVEKLANNLLASVSFDSPPVPLDDIVNKIGLKKVEFDFANELSGVLKPERKIIGINKKNSPARKRFTIAHELGHYILGHDEIDFVDDKFDRPLPKEREANLFASMLLMPASLVKKYFNDSQDIERLAAKFEVSEQAITIRLLELNLIK